METIIKACEAFVLGLVIAFAVGVIMAIPIMLLWDWLMPTIFGLPTITLWQAFGLKILSEFFIGGIKSNIKKDD